MNFTPNFKNIHIGSIIRKKLKNKSITITEFALKINRERTTVYDIFRRKSIDIELLIEISKALEYDFIGEIYLLKKTPSLQFFAVQEDKVQKLNLPKETIQFVKKEK